YFAAARSKCVTSQLRHRPDCASCCTTKEFCTELRHNGNRCAPGESRMRLHRQDGADPQRHQLAAVGCVSKATTTLMRAERTLARPRLKSAWAVSHLLRSLRCGRPVALLLRKSPKSMPHAGLQPLALANERRVSLLPTRLERYCFPLRMQAHRVRSHGRADQAPSRSRCSPP